MSETTKTATAPKITRYEVCATILFTCGEAHTRFLPVQVIEGYSTRADIPKILAIRFALGGKVSNVSVISVTELDEEMS